METLRSVTYICSDKTGTLTQNQMHVEVVFAAGKRLQELPAADHDESVWQYLGWVMALNNTVTEAVATGDADAEQNGEESAARVPVGDPTEVALVLAAQQAGYDKATLATQLPQTGELAFEEQRKCMTTVHWTDDGAVSFTKGAPETVLELCTHWLTTKAYSRSNRSIGKPYCSRFWHSLAEAIA